MALIGVQSKDVDDVWPYCHKWLSRAIALNKGRVTEESIKEGLRARDYQLWVAVDHYDVPVGAAVTELREHRTGDKSVHIFLAGGVAVGTFFDCQDVFLAWAKEKGASRLTADCRLGLLKKMPGWRPLTVMMERAI